MINLNGYYDSNGYEIVPRLLQNKSKLTTGFDIKKQIDNIIHDLANQPFKDMYDNIRLGLNPLHKYITNNPDLSQYFQQQISLATKIKMCQEMRTWTDKAAIEYCLKNLIPIDNEKSIDYATDKYEDWICQHILLNKQYTLQEALDLYCTLKINQNININDCVPFMKNMVNVKEFNLLEVFEACKSAEDFKLVIDSLAESKSFDSQAFHALQMLSQSSLPKKDIQEIAELFAEKAILYESREINRSQEMPQEPPNPVTMAPMDNLNPIIKKVLIDKINRADSQLKDKANASPMIYWGLKQMAKKNRHILMQSAKEIFEFFKSLINNKERTVYQICNKEDNEFLAEVEPPQDKEVIKAMEAIELDNAYSTIENAKSRVLSMDVNQLELNRMIAAKHNDTGLVAIIDGRLKTLEQIQETQALTKE